MMSIDWLTKHTGQTKLRAVLDKLQLTVNETDGSYSLPNETDDNMYIAMRLYSKIKGMVISTCFRESPHAYLGSDLAARIKKGSSSRITKRALLTETERMEVERAYAQYRVTSKLVVLNEGTRISEINGIFANERWKLHRFHGARQC